VLPIAPDTTLALELSVRQSGKKNAAAARRKADRGANHQGDSRQGRRAADPQIAQAFRRDGETLVGWISTGTPKITPSPRMAGDVVRIVSDF